MFNLTFFATESSLATLDIVLLLILIKYFLWQSSISLRLQEVRVLLLGNCGNRPTFKKKNSFVSKSSKYRR